MANFTHSVGRRPNLKKRGKFLAQLKVEGTRQILSNYYLQLDLYRSQIKEILLALRQESRKYPAIKNIRSVSGIGLVRAVTLFALIVNPRRFSARNKLNKYCGLSTVENMSAGKVYSSYASKKGNRLLKQVLLEGATTAIFVCKENYFKTRYEELIAKGL